MKQGIMIDSDRRGKEQKKYNQYDYEDRILRDSLDGLDFRPKVYHLDRW